MSGLDETTKALLAKTEQLLPPNLDRLRAQVRSVLPSSVAIGEIAGRDSIAAILAAVSRDSIRAVIPSVAYTATEYGDWEIVNDTTRRLTEQLSSRSVLVTEPVLLGSPQLWAALNGRAMIALFQRFGFCTPCIGCHLYLHLIRVPLAHALGVEKVISGERESHDGRVKVNQTGAALQAYSRVLAEAGVELLLPIQSVASGEEIERMVGEGWPEGGRQLSCVLSGNYERATEDFFNERAVRGFLEEYLIPCGEAVLSLWQSAGSHDYWPSVRNVLERGVKRE